MSKRVIVIGGGVIGLSAAAECARRGHQVTVIEGAPDKRGASFGNAGMVVPSHVVPLAAPGMVALGLRWMWNPESPFYIQPRFDWDLLSWAWRFYRSCTRAHVKRSAPLLRDLHLASRAIYAELADAGEDFGFTQRGLLMLCHTEHGLEEEAQAAAKAHALGLRTEVLNARQAAELDPDMTMDVAGAVYFPQDCHLRPERVIASLEHRIRTHGGELQFGPAAVGWHKSGDQVIAVKTTAGEIAGDEFILASGAWSPEVVAPLGLKLPMQAGKGYSITIPRPIELPRLCSILCEARVAVTPMGGAVRFGGTMEIAGFSERINPRRVAGILKSVALYLPNFRPDHFAGIEPWCGLRPCSPDGLPFLGRTGAASNLIVASGHAMMGVSLAPITGELVGQLVDREPTRFDLSLLSPDRYA